jgi:hypothetical protein
MSEIYERIKNLHEPFTEIFEEVEYNIDKKFKKWREILLLIITYYKNMNKICKLKDIKQEIDQSIFDDWDIEFSKTNDLSLRDLFNKLFLLNLKLESYRYDVTNFSFNNNIEEIDKDSRIYLVLGENKIKIVDILNGIFDEKPYSFAYLSDPLTTYIPHAGNIISYFTHDIEHHNNTLLTIKRKLEDGTHHLCVEIYNRYPKDSFIFRYIAIVYFMTYHENGTYLSPYSKNILAEDLMLDILQSNDDKDVKNLFKFILNSKDMSNSRKNDCLELLNKDLNQFDKNEYGLNMKYEIISEILYDEVMEKTPDLFEDIIKSLN